jgi:hypothetical protein
VIIPFFRTTFEYQNWSIHGLPTGGAGFGGTIGELTTNSFASAGIGRANLVGLSLARGSTGKRSGNAARINSRSLKNHDYRQVSGCDKVFNQPIRPQLTMAKNPFWRALTFSVQ